MNYTKKILFIVLALSSMNIVYGQKLKDRLKAAKEKMNSKLETAVSGKDYSGAFDSVAFENMIDFANELKTGKIKMFVVNEAVVSLVGVPEDLKVTKKDGKTSVVEVHNWKYAASYNDDSDILLCFKHYMGTRMYFKKDKFFTYYLDSETKKVKIKEMFGGKEPMNKISAEIEAYEKWAAARILADVGEADAKRKAKREAEAAERLAKYGLADKAVKSIEVITDVPAKFGYYIPFRYHVVATLKNGTKISTENGKGFIDDYIITAPKTDFNGAIETGFLDSDELVITAKLKKNPSISNTKKISIPYNSSLRFELYGKGWYHKRGDNGYDVTLKIKQEKHSVTGKPVLRVRLESNASYASLREFSISPDQAIIVDCHGGDGGNEEGHFNGGNGGNVRVIKDPSVESFYVDYNVNGGAKGGYNASAGRDGRYTVTEQKVNF